MKTSDFYFDLPEELIAQEPLADRASSRLMVVHKDSGKREHRHFRDIKEYLRAGDCLVINNTKVLPARLYGERVGTGAAMEILLLVRKDMDTWEDFLWRRQADCGGFRGHRRRQSYYQI